MAINTYATLVSAITEYLARDQDATLTARIPDFITLAEAKFNRILFMPQMETRDTLTVDTGATSPELLDLPTDFQSFRRNPRLSGVTGKPALEFLTGTQMDDLRFARDDTTGQPLYYSVGGSQIELLPTPNDDYDVEIVYRAKISALTSTNTTNWLLTLAPDLYLYGALMEAAPYTKNQTWLPVWVSGFTTALDALTSLGDRQAFDSGPSTLVLPGPVP